jgi:hypothetical protein
VGALPETLLRRTGQFNLAVSCFTRTMTRELEVMDFSWATFKAGLCLLQARRVASQNIASALFSDENVWIFAALFLAIFTFGGAVQVCCFTS